MKKTSLALAVAAVAAFSSQAVLAQDYQMEAGVNYTSFDYDGFSDSAIGVDFTYYLEQVATSGKPLAEAAWLNRNNNVGLGYTTQDKFDVSTINLNGEFWFEDIYVSADLDRWDDGLSSDDGIDYSLRAGYMIQDGLLAYAGFDNGDGYDDPTIHVGAKYVAQLGDNFVNLEGDYASNDGDSLISLKGDYFLSNELSVGAGIGQSSISGAKTEIGVNAKYFFMPNVYGALEYTLNDGNADKVNVIGLRVAARF